MQKLGKIVIVSEHYAPDSSTTAAYMTAIARGLTAIAETLVLSGTKNSAVSAAKDDEPRVVEIDNWVPEKGALVKRSFAILLFSIRTFFVTFRQTSRNDMVFCVTTPFTLPFAVTLAAKLRGATAMLLIYDLYPEALEMAGLVKPGSLLTKGIRFANGFLFRVLDAIITIGRDVEPLLLRYKGVQTSKIKFIPNWTLLPIHYRALTSENPFRRPHTEKLVVGLSGNLGFTHSAKTVFETAKLLEGEPNIQFLLSGWGSGWEKLKELQAAAPLGNVTLMNPVPNSELEDFLAAADVWVIPYRRNIAGVSVPSRLYNLLAVGRPVIVAAEATSEAALIVQEEGIGWVVPPENPTELANAIRAAASDHAATALKGRQSAIAALKYTHDRAMAGYRQVVGNVLRAGFERQT
ncbi:MAG: hypothetical protein BGN91_08980 [Nitrobacter sp. 62-13]|nr:MAG: hypothetical protein BGN91_08980 [Nitrobacter sp. 62-13]